MPAAGAPRGSWGFVVTDPRLYFAIWPDAALRERIAAATAGVRTVAGGRAVPPADYHVTLAFLGAVPAGRVDAAQSAAARVACAPAVQVFDRVECWGRHGPLVVAAGATAPALAALEEALRNSLIAAGFVLVERRFRPHITLAREPAARVPAQSPAEPLAWPFGEFVLVESHLGRTGARYEVVARFPCRPEPAAGPPEP